MHSYQHWSQFWKLQAFDSYSQIQMLHSKIHVTQQEVSELYMFTPQLIFFDESEEKQAFQGLDPNLDPYLRLRLNDP